MPRNTAHMHVKHVPWHKDDLDPRELAHADDARCTQELLGWKCMLEAGHKGPHRKDHAIWTDSKKPH